MYQTKRTYQPYAGKVVSGPSRTVPDQTMSLRDILSRYARGLPIMGTNQPPSFGSEDDLGVDFKNLDLAEREDFIKAREQELEQLKIKINSTKNVFSQGRTTEATGVSEAHEGSVHKDSLQEKTLENSTNNT